METKIILDKRRIKEDGTYPIKFTVFNKTQIYLPSGISVKENEFNKGIVIGRSDVKRLNTLLRRKKMEYDMILINLELGGKLKKITSDQLKKALLGLEDKVNFKSHFLLYMDSILIESTQETYSDTLDRIAKFCDLDDLAFSDINFGWLSDFENYYSSLSINTRGIYFRNIRTVFNDAINRDIVSQEFYPFKKFKIKTEDTEPKPMEVEEFKSLRDMPCSAPKQRFKDMFLLSFYLRGLNMKDILFLQPEDIEKGYIVKGRSKTDVPLRIKIFPEAQEIIDRYRGEKYLLNCMDTRSNHKDFERRINAAIKELGIPQKEITKYRNRKDKKKENKPIGPFYKVSLYWARYSFATFAADLDVPDKYIDIMLGHKRNGMIDKYVKRQQDKIDEYHRMVLDYVKK